jgi:hypothetical protein
MQLAVGVQQRSILTKTLITEGTKNDAMFS